MADSGGPRGPDVGPGYTIVRELGGGGMSRVFVAREHALDREIVLKVLAPELAESLSAARFGREIRLAAALQDPHIVPVHSAGLTAEGLPYYTMPFVRGESLRARIAAGPLPVPEAVAILRDVARALDYAHGHGIVHRDIKPENILLSGGSAVVADFGIAKAISAARDESRRTAGQGAGGMGTSALTSAGTSLGTPAYMAPEQAAGDPDVDHRADIYAWGVVAWELLGGRHPFGDRGSAHRLIAAHISEPPPPLVGVKPALARLVMRCLEKSPEARPRTVRELLVELDAASTAERATGERPPDGAARGPWRRLAVAVALVLAITGGLWAVRSGRASRDGEAAGGARSVGVVPFTSLAGDRDDAYFSEGVTQEIADALGRVPGIRVAYHNPDLGTSGAAPTRDPRTLGRQLRVESVLLGTVQRAGNRIRVSARLVNTEDGFQLWSESFDREVSDVFALQDDVARAIATGLLPNLAPGRRDTLVRVATSDPVAHDLYLRGMYFWNRRGAENIYKSLTLFDSAIARDPRFARAWAGKALAYAIIVTWDDVDVPEMLGRAVAAADSALRRDSTNSEAWAAIAEARSSLWRNAEANVAFEKALALDPNNATAHQWYGEHLGRLGRYDEALRHVRRAQQLAPLSLVVNTQEGRVLLEARRFEEAKAALRRVLELDSTYSTANLLYGAALLQQRRHREAIDHIRRAVAVHGRTPGLLFLGHAHATSGAEDSARALLEEVERRRSAGEFVSHAGLALLLHALGDTARAIAMLDTAVRRYDGMLGMHASEAVFDPLRKDPRGGRILAPVQGPE